MTDTRAFTKSSSEYRLQAREQLAGNWGKFALLYLILFSVTIALNFIPLLGFVAKCTIAGPISLGIVVCMLKLFHDKTFVLEDILEGFTSFVPALLVYLLTLIFTILWSLLLIIPGIMAAYSYSMAFYILRENPELSPLEVIRESKALMKGHRMDLFLLHLSFIGWGLLSILSLGIGGLWLMPYVGAATTAFYLDLTAGQRQLRDNPVFVEPPRESTVTKIEF